jgi:hypothetical protein
MAVNIPTVNDGDPVTSNILRAIKDAVVELQNKDSAAVNINNQNDTTVVTSDVYAKQYGTALNATSPKVKTVDFVEKLKFSFEAPPVVTLQLRKKSSSKTSDMKYYPLLLEVTTTGFTWIEVPMGAKANYKSTDVMICWTASGKKAPTATE